MQYVLESAKVSQGTKGIHHLLELPDVINSTDA